MIFITVDDEKGDVIAVERIKAVLNESDSETTRSMIILDGEDDMCVPLSVTEIMSRIKVAVDEAIQNDFAQQHGARGIMLCATQGGRN